MATYELLVCDLRTDRQLDRIPVTGVSYDDYIGRTGSLSATIPIPDSAMASRVRGSVLPGRTMVYLEKWDAFAGTVVWGGILWTRTPTRDARGFYSCPIQAAGIESVLRAHRMLTADLVAAGADQFAIARQIVTYAQSLPGGDLSIEMDTSQLSGVLRDRTYSRYDLPRLGDLLDKLAAVESGFEWRIQIYRDDAGVRHRVLRLGYPEITTGGQPVVLTSPGPVTAYALPEDATLQANSWQSRGASVDTDVSTESVPLMSALLTTPADIAAGWPLLENSSDYSTVETQDVLDSHATADLARAVRPVVVPSVTIVGQTPPALGSTIRLRITDTWHYDGLDTQYRLVGYKVSPEERGRPESAELYLEAA